VPRFAFPISLDVDRKLCLVLGGGPEATDKARRLALAGARVQVIADEIEPELAALVDQGTIGWAARGWTVHDLPSAYLIILTPEERDRAAEARRLALAAGTLFCSIDDPDRCDFATPAVFRVADVQVALSSGGRVPAVLRRLRQDLEKALSTEEMRAFIEAMAALREELPPGERGALRERVEGFGVAAEAHFPAWFTDSRLPGAAASGDDGAGASRPAAIGSPPGEATEPNDKAPEGSEGT
jgi:precorrin-2 dehydrogenase/sirohydrochlorin ferrochelatase